MKSIIVLMIFFFYSEVFCQNISEWRWGIAFSPGISRQAPISNLDLLSQKEFRRSSFSYSTGISFLIKNKKHSSIQTGIGYMRKNIKFVMNYVMPIGQPMETAIIQNIYNDLEVPILYRLFLGKNKYRISPSIGGIAGFNLRQVLITNSPSNNHIQVFKFNGLNNTNTRYNFYIGLGNVLRFKNNNSLLIEPFFKWDMSRKLGRGRISDDTNRTFGISTSLFYKLNKEF